MQARTSLVALPSILAVMLAIAAPARAQNAEPAQPPQPRPPATALTPQQLDAFVELTGDPKPLVWQRLLADPGLVPFAAAAADARLDRRSTGKSMTIAGFTILGVGTGVGYVVFVAGLASGMDCSYPNTCEPDKSLMLGGVGLMIASIATGLSLGIPGIIRMARQSEAETAATDRYQYPGLPQVPAYPGPYREAMRLRAPGVTLSAPLLSFTF